MHGYGLHEQVIVFIVDQSRDVMDHLEDNLLMGMVWFWEELIEIPG